MSTTSTSERQYNARPDSMDFRDKIYTANLYEVPTQISLEEYKALKVPILDQGQEGACTGFGLATVANYLLMKRKVVPDANPVSARMIYQMARRYDEWPGEDYSGSSARGAMKGWHKHGVCGDNCWPYNQTSDPYLNESRATDALQRPLGAYYRVNHKDLVSMHTAMAEVGILYATATVHEGWQNVDGSGVIEMSDKIVGGHAFAIVAYDRNGFWIQNSWGNIWGADGFGLISYDDWLANGTDVWVARLGAPVILRTAQSIATSHSAAAGKSNSYSYANLRPHIVSIGNNGLLKPGGDFGTSKAEVISIFRNDIPTVTKDWDKVRILLYAHGGLVDESSAVQRIAEYRSAMLEEQVYPVAFIWHSDFWSTSKNILEDALRSRRPEGFIGDAKDFMLDRLDDALEPLARALTGKSQWDEMKENAMLASLGANGGARIVLDELAQLAQDPRVEIHIVGHSAGAIFHAPLIALLTGSKAKITAGVLKGKQGYGLSIESCTLWAPACTTTVFKDYYLPAIKKSKINRFALFTLKDQAERDDNCAQIYHKSLLYLVSNAFEDAPRIPLFRNDGDPILGMEKFVRSDEAISKLFSAANCDWILSPNIEVEGSESASAAAHHGDFDDDIPTVKATLKRILGDGKKLGPDTFQFNKSASALKDKRQGLVRSNIMQSY